MNLNKNFKWEKNDFVDINIILYTAVKVQLENDTLTGWFVKSHIWKNKYCILPFGDNAIVHFSKSQVKSIQYLNNGLIIPYNKIRW